MGKKGQKNSIKVCQNKRVRRDLNPRSPASKADTLIRARLQTLSHAFRLGPIHP